VKRFCGFTLVEMLVVLLMMSILATAAVPLARINERRVKETELRAALRTLRGAIDSYKQQWNTGHIEKKPDDTGYPPDLQSLVSGVVDVADPKGRKIYFLRRIPRDPFADPQTPAEQTWALRSYDSPVDAPAAGKDVFDVTSTAPGTGLDGVAYRQW
jgi:general secretion pathway protein G